MFLRRITLEEVETVHGVPFEEPAQPASVSELTQRIRETLEIDFAEVLVQGEISAWTRAASGHTYFTLKDDRATLSCVLWRTRRLTHPITVGMKVTCAGAITVYPPRGAYQLDCTSIVPLGQGELQIAFERLKARLQEEGLFDAERKRPIPLFPRAIGVVTSPTGAAIRDIITTIERRMPSVKLVLAPALVQGIGAAGEIVAAIERLNRREDIDLLIVGRGGGSIEDLWAFNEEPVARAIASSRIPVISAVGHEIDFTIADFVADLRAPTPTAAAELAVRHRDEILAFIGDASERLTRTTSRYLDRLGDRLRALERSRGLHRPLEIIRSRAQQVDEMTRRSDLAVRGGLRSVSERLRRLDASLRALNPEGVLARGYAIVERDGEPVADAQLLSTGEKITLRMRDGRRKAEITE